MNENRIQQVERLNEAMARLIVMMQEIDDTCVRLSEDISKKELLIVQFVGANGKVIMKDIADYMKIPVSTTTGIVDRLVHKKYLQRIFSEHDRRSISIVLDSLGERTDELMTKMKTAMANRILDDLQNEEANHFIGLLEKVTGNLHKFAPEEV